jgi:hypothetical protein
VLQYAPGKLIWWEMDPGGDVSLVRSSFAVRARNVRVDREARAEAVKILSSYLVVLGESRRAPTEFGTYRGMCVSAVECMGLWYLGSCEDDLRGVSI